MAKQTINVGTSANDGTGDTLRASQQKAVNNFNDLYDDGGANITVNNPVTSTETTLDVALADLVGGGGATPNLNEVVIAGGTAISTDTFSSVNFDIDSTLATFYWLMRKDATDKQTTMYSNPNTIYLLSQTPTKDSYVEILDGEFSIKERVSGVDATSTTVNFEEPTNNTILKFPAKAVDGTYTLATTDDVGGSQTLAETLVLGNITDGTDISISVGDAVILDNTSKLKKGTTNAGLGGNNGIAFKCSLDYEFKWEAGTLYIMEQDGFTIRETKYNFNLPTVTDDDTKGFIIGSRWLIENKVYKCTDATTGSAVWLRVYDSATDLGNTPAPTKVTVNSSTGTGTDLPLADATNAGLLKPADFTQLSTLATDLADKVDKSDYTPAHSILVQQSGTGSPSALQIGTNTLVGRLSGGGSDINDLSVSDVKTLLSINNVDNTSDANKPISTATQTALDLRTREILQDFTDYTSTGVLTEQIISNQAITANDMKINSFLNFISTYSRTGTTNATVSIYVNTTSNSLVGAVKIAMATITSTQSLPCFKRDFSINASSVLRGVLFSANAVTDEIATQAQSTTTLTLGSAYYLITSVSLNNVADTVTQRAINLKSSK
jgi:hypothetical protein